MDGACLGRYNRLESLDTVFRAPDEQVNNRPSD